MKIIIGCSKSSGLDSKIIRWWMKTDYSHVYTRWHLNTQNRDIIYQADNNVVSFTSFDNFKINNTIIKEFTLDLDDNNFIKFSQKCIDLTGQSYSYLEILQIFLCNLSKNKIKFKDQPGYICSELVGELLEDFFNTKFDKPKYLLTPKDIISFLEKNNR